MDGQSMTEARGGGGGGANTNWKTLADVKNEHLGHGEKVWIGRRGDTVSQMHLQTYSTLVCSYTFKK